MGEMKNPAIRISNLGPIKRASIEIKPLTIFVGGHNTGKSYAAQVVYAMAKVLRGSYLRMAKVEGVKDLGSRVVREELKALEKVIGSRRGGSFREGVVGFSEVGAALQAQAAVWWTGWEGECKKEMKSSLRRYFKVTDIGDLVRLGNESAKCSITLCAAGGNAVRTRLLIGKKLGKVNVSMVTPRIQTLGIGVFRSSRELDYFDFQYGLMEAWRKPWKGIADHDCYYLPAARSGILQLWDMVQLYTLENLPEEFGFTDLVRDFLGNIARTSVRGWGREEKRGAAGALEVLENEIMRGEVVLVRERPGPLRLEYRFGEGASLGIQRASSMVAELAPLDLFIKGVLGKGDLLIIEEPEAHLHPSSQIQIAKLIARLVNSGIRVMCTTHSPLLVNRISNLVLAGGVRESVRKELGLKRADIIKEEDLGVYQFVATGDGSLVKRVKMVSKFGIPEDEFLEEYEKISLESYKVSG
jgi:hypothetical protein